MTAYKRSSLSVTTPHLAGSKGPGVVSAESLRSFVVFDGLTRFIMPLLSAVRDRPGAEEPVTKTLILADIAGLDMRQLWNLKRYLQDFNALLAINYPEILDRVLVRLFECSSGSLLQLGQNRRWSVIADREAPDRRCTVSLLHHLEMD